MLILASRSPRRRELLTQAGYTFTVRSADIPEVSRSGEDAVRLTLRLAREKAEAVATALAPAEAEAVVLGADTVVAVDGEILGKPRDAADAGRMLRLLSGRTHQVVTGVCALRGERQQSGAEVTHVCFRALSDAEIADYIASGEPWDKAGAYAIQGHAGRWVPRISGCYFNVVGLPLALVASMLEAMLYFAQ
jgi:nucleoside triphosphate pyrophosphatase